MNLAAASPIKTNTIVRLLLCFMPLIGMGVDVIAPSLPAINQSLHVSAVLAKVLIPIFIVGAAIGTFSSGILSDVWGRRPLMRSGFALIIIASILPSLWPTASTLLFARFCQGLAIGTMSVMVRAIISDLLVDAALIRAASWMASLWGVGPLIGPMIGGYLQVYFGWQANFLFFAGYGIIGLAIALFILPETHVHRHTLNISKLKQNFAVILPNKIFLSLSVLMGCLYSTLIIYNTLAPFYIQKWLGYSPIFFGHAAFALGFIFLCGTFCCRALVKRFPAEQILTLGMPSVFIFTLIAIVMAHHGQSLWTILPSNALLFFACGLLYPTCMGVTMNSFKEMAGSASAVATLINLLITASAGFLVSFISAHSAKPIAYASSLAIAIGLAFYYWAKKRDAASNAVIEDVQ